MGRTVQKPQYRDISPLIPLYPLPVQIDPDNGIGAFA